MEDRRQTPDLALLEEKVGELERLADTLGDVPDEKLSGVLDEAVRLLGEINARLEAGIGAAEDGSREVGALLEGMDFGLFDEALESLERQERADDPDAT
ncbi:MAG TPA: hypothetical protein VK869_12150 [Rubrobacteraceae bacterium]|nr:hypothetical protein [Rubrobacteraceae bacterium]